MSKKLLGLLAALLVATSLQAAPAFAEMSYLRPLRRAQQYNWHANYAHTMYGGPVALVVPPTVQMETNWSWGAPSAHFRRVDHQFGRDYPGPGPFGGGFRSTPLWPHNMDQFGVYSVRAPWYPMQR